jgi:hypothetical protein
MESVCVAIPLKPGMWETLRKYRDELFQELDHAELAYARDHRGFKTVRIFHQSTPMEALILYFEAEDLRDTFHPRHQNDATSAKWTAFWNQIAGLQGPLLSEFPQVLLDWAADAGHRHKGAHHTGAHLGR